MSLYTGLTRTQSIQYSYPYIPQVLEEGVDPKNPCLPIMPKGFVSNQSKKDQAIEAIFYENHPKLHPHFTEGPEQDGNFDSKIESLSFLIGPCSYPRKFCIYTKERDFRCDKIILYEAWESTYENPREFYDQLIFQVSSRTKTVKNTTFLTSTKIFEDGVVLSLLGSLACHVTKNASRELILGFVDIPKNTLEGKIVLNQLYAEYIVRLPFLYPNEHNKNTLQCTTQDLKECHYLGQIFMFCLNASTFYPLSPPLPHCTLEALQMWTPQLTRRSFDTLDFTCPKILQQMIVIYTTLHKCNEETLRESEEQIASIKINCSSSDNELRVALKQVENDPEIISLHLTEDATALREHLKPLQKALCLRFIEELKNKLAPLHAMASAMEASPINFIYTFHDLRNLETSVFRKRLFPDI